MTTDMSVKERLQRIDEIRDKITCAGNLLSGHLSKLTTEVNEENKEHIQRIKREIRTILNQLGRLSELCNKSSKITIDKLSRMGARYTMYQGIRTFHGRKMLMELWASNALIITTGLNLHKWPFEIQGGIKARIGKFFDVHIKGKTRRPE